MSLKPHEITALRAGLAGMEALFLRVENGETGTAAPSEGRRGKPGSRPPLNLTVIHITDTRHKPGWDGLDPRVDVVVDRFGVLPALESWTRLVRDEMMMAGVPWPDMLEVPTVGGEAGWLLATMDFSLAHEWVVELADDVRRLTSQLMAVLGERREYRPRCREIACGAKLDPMDNATWYSCPSCGRDYTIDADLKALGQVQPAMTGREVADALGIPWATLRKWVERGILTHTGRDAKGRKVYDLDAVRRVAERVRAS